MQRTESDRSRSEVPRMTIFRIWIANHRLDRYFKKVACLMFLSSLYVGNIHAAPVLAGYRNRILPAHAEQNGNFYRIAFESPDGTPTVRPFNQGQPYFPEFDGELVTNLQPSFTLAQYRPFPSSTYAEKTMPSRPVTTIYPEDMICSKDSARPDQDLNLHEQIAQTERGPIGYYRFGHGSPLILITGYLSTLSEWNAFFLSELANKYEVIVFDNRGIGQSATSTSNYRVEDLALDTAALVKALGFNSASILGWSMGGMIAQRLVLDQPSVVNHLILLNSAPPGHNSTPASNQVEEELSGHGSNHFDDVMKILFPAGEVQSAESCFKGDMFRPHDYVPAKISANVSTAQERLVQDWALDDHSFAALRHVRVPTLILAGTEDEVLGLRNSVILSNTIPHAKLIEVQSGGHAMMYQYPKALADLIDTFISRER
jgi:pimeloyl-ACP methyl ester carboxylesterase